MSYGGTRFQGHAPSPEVRTSGGAVDLELRAEQPEAAERQVAIDEAVEITLRQSTLAKILIQPQIDIEKIVRALVLEAMDQAKRERLKAKSISPLYPSKPSNLTMKTSQRKASRPSVRSAGGWRHQLRGAP